MLIFHGEHPPVIDLGLVTEITQSYEEKKKHTDVTQTEKTKLNLAVVYSEHEM